MQELLNREIPKTSAEEVFAPEPFVAPLAIKVQREYYSALGLNDDDAIIDWIESNSESFREAFNEVLRDIYIDIDFVDALEQARHGDDKVLSTVILRRVTALLKPDEEGQEIAKGE